MSLLEEKQGQIEADDRKCTMQDLTLNFSARYEGLEPILQEDRSDALILMV